MKKNILITGGAGYIGSHIGYLLAQQGYQVISIDSHEHEQAPVGNWAISITGSIGDRNTLEQLFATYPIDTVIHCAAFIDIANSIKNPLNFYENNVANTITLLNAMHANGVKKIIFSSSCAVYGSPLIVPMPEDHPKNPISPYGHSKLMGETILADAATAYQIRSITFRYFNAVGAMPDYGLCEWHVPEIHLIPRLLHAVYEHRPFTIYGSDYETVDGTCVRDFIHVWDIAHAHLIAMHKLNEGHPSDMFNLGTGKGHSIKQIIHALEHIVQRPILVEHASRRPGDPATLVADATKAHNILGWRPQFSDLPFILRSAHAAQQMLWEKQILLHRIAQP